MWLTAVYRLPVTTLIRSEVFMPGLSFAFDFEPGLQRKPLSASLSCVMHSDNYEGTILLSDVSYCLAYTGYKEYPIECIDNERHLIYIEGHIYGKNNSVIRQELDVVADWLFSPLQKRKDIARWLLDTDGEFLLFVLDKQSQSVAFLNDALGRLPAYYSGTPTRLIVSREFRLIAQLCDTVKFDSMGVAQYLLFGYPLGRRTLLENVDRLSPSSVITIDNRRRSTTIVQVHDFNFETRQYPHRSIDENTEELVKLFSKACLDRSSVNNLQGVRGRIILGLSGGLDSRTVAVGLQNNGIPFIAVTRLDYLGVSASDAEIAEQLARTLGIDWRLIRLEPTLGKDLLSVLRMKNGLNYLGLATIMPFLARIRDEYGAGALYFTGDGGDKVLRDLRPCWKLRNLDSLVSFILSRNQRFSLRNVAAVTRIPEKEIMEELRVHVSSFPEKSWSQKYIHFLLSERAFKLVFEGEDKNRFLFWSVTPFYSIEFFRYAMGCPDHQKEKFALHRSILLALSPMAGSISYANWKVPLSGNRYLLYLFIRSIIDRVPPRLKKSIQKVKLITQRRSLDNYRSCLRDELTSSLCINKYVDSRFLERMANNCNKSEMAILLTIASAIEESECRESTLARYHDVQFA